MTANVLPDPAEQVLTDEQWTKMIELGRDVRRLMVRRSEELGLPLDKSGLAVLLLLVHTAEPRWDGVRLRERLRQMLDLAIELREVGELEKAWGRAEVPEQPPAVTINRDVGQ